MAKIRKFREGSTVEDAEEARYKTAGLAASNAELESGKRKPSGFLGLGRFLEGNIDQKGSEAYNLYGAGYGREVEATNTRLKAAKESAASAASAASAEKETNYRSSGDYNNTADMKRSQGSAAAASTESGSGSAPAAKAPAAKAPAPAASGSAASGSAASGSGGGRGPSYAEVDAEKQRGFTASPMSTDQAQRAAATAARAAAAAKAAADAPVARNPETDEGEDVRPASQAQLRALAAIARATGSTSGVASGRVTAAEAARKIAEYAKKIGNTALSVGDSFKNYETLAERRSRLTKEAKDKETASFNRERGDRAKGGAIKSYAKGGSVSAASRGDGIAQRGKTRGRMC